MDKTLLVIMVVLALGLLTIGSALAQTAPSGVSITAQDDLGQFPYNANASVSLIAGSIRDANITSDASTIRWAGLFGTASGTLNLGDSNNKVMYTWPAVGRIVYSVQTGGVDWGSLGDASAAQVKVQFPWLADAATADNYDETFTGGSEPVDSDLFTVSSDYALTYDDVQAPTWKTYSLKDGNNKFIFAGVADQSGTGIAYSGERADYQIIIPEDGTQLDDTPTTWDLFIELI
jgi:hypothetical protein